MRAPVLPPRAVVALAVLLAAPALPALDRAATAAVSSPAPVVAPARAPAAPAAAGTRTSRSTARATAATPVDDPAGWSDARLGAQLVLAGVDMGQLDRATPWVRGGLGGVVLFGTPPDDLGRRLAALRAAGQVPPLVGSDEEGGRVQRLTRLLGALPSAEALGRSRSPEQVRRLAYGYGVGMRDLGVDLDLAPVADLAVPGHYVERLDRGFSADPAAAGAYAVAWQEGMRAAHVATSVKHWPGHGQASGDTHRGAATTPHVDVLDRRDLLPFRRTSAAGAPAVMVGHLTVPGLTEPRTPASLSPAALAKLRREAGPATLLLTDSLTMRAVTTALGLTPAQASVRALQAGADVALVDAVDPVPVMAAVQRAITSGALPRDRAVASVRRVLAVKGLVAAPAVASAPAATALTDGSALVAYTAPRGRVHVRRWSAGGWGRGTDLGGPSAAAPAVATVRGAVVVAARSPDGTVRTRTWRGGAWSPWAAVAGGATEAPALAALPDGRLALAVRDGQGRVLLRLTRPGGGWTPPGHVLTSAAGPALAAAGDELVVAGRTSTGAVVVRSWRSGGWTAPVTLDGVTDAAPALAGAPDGTVSLAVRGTDRRVRVRSRAGDTWQSWQDLGGVATAAPAVVALGGGGTAVLARAGRYADLYLRSGSGGDWSSPWQRWS